MGEPIAIVDDIVNSGRGALKTATLLRCAELSPSAVVSVFAFPRGGAAGRLEREGVGLVALAELRAR